MKSASLDDLQNSVQDRFAFGKLDDYSLLGYTVALNRLDGVYYVDPRPEMLVNERLREQVFDFQQFLVEDLWKLSR